jgi:NitT/TauT family transport system substrate-binding protein
MRPSVLLLAAVLLVGCKPVANPASEVRIAIGGRAALDFVPVYIASSLGYFRDAGLKVTLQDLPGTPKAVQSLLGGSSELVAGGYDAAIELAGEKDRLQAVAVLERWPPLAIVAPSSTKPIRTIRDLKGATVGVSSPGSSTHRFLNYVLAKGGLSSSDVTPIGVGVNFTMAAAIEHGRVQAAVAGPLGMALLEKTTAVSAVVDCRKADSAQHVLGTDNLPFIALLARSKWVGANGDTLRKVGRAMRRSLQWIHEHSAEQVTAAMPEQYKGKDPALYLTAVRIILPVFSRDGLMPPDGPSHMRDYLAASDPHLLRADLLLDETYTNDYIQKQ